MTNKTVTIKGIRGGLLIFIPPAASISDVAEAINKKLSMGKPFFEGATVNLTFVGNVVDEEQQQELIKTVSRYMQVGTVVFKTDEDKKTDKPSDEKNDYFSGIEEGMTRFVKGTVRNGQRIDYEGNIVVLGDVNPGGEIVAGGNILILGTIRGLAHAGATGNQKAVVAAYCLQPTQLRIAGTIARAPEGESVKPEYPEIAYIKDGMLIIEPYLPGKVKIGQVYNQH